MYILNNDGTDTEPLEHHSKTDQNDCKSHSPLFVVSTFQSKMPGSIENLYLHHMHLVLQVTTGFNNYHKIALRDHVRVPNFAVRDARGSFHQHGQV